MKQVDFITGARDAAIEWARALMATPAEQVLILDTETTGLDGCAEIIQLALIDLSGNEVMNTLVRPKYSIPADATAIHGITDLDVSAAPSWSDLAPTFEELVKGKIVVIYNSAYDARVLRQTYRINDVVCLNTWESVHCAMQEYAEFVGEWDDRRGSFRWQKLRGGDHSAIGDCLATLKLIRGMADSKHSND